MNKYINILLGIILIGLASASPQPVFAAESEGTISVVSFDGLGYMDAKRYMNKGVMPNLQAFQQESAYAANFTTIAPSLTAPSHATMATGASPAQTGVVSNHFHASEDEVDEDESGFSQTLGVTPIWKEAENQGKVTATVSFPDSNPENASAATYSVYSGGTLAESDLHDLDFNEVSDKRIDQLPSKPRKAEEAVVDLDIKDAPSQQLFILRTIEKEPKLYISQNQKTIGDELTADTWFPVVLDAPAQDSAGFYAMLKGNPENKDELQLFQGTVMGGLYKGPGKFAEQIESQFGFYPAADELDAFNDGEITREEYEEVTERFAKWVTDVSSFIKDTYHPDLLFYYYPIVDTELHEFLLRDPAQPGYTEDNVQEKEAYVSWAFGLADQAIGKIQEIQEKNDHLILISDHGLEPIHTRLSPNEELEKAGLLVKDENGAIDPAKTKAYAEASGTIAHVYVNLKGREEKGSVDEAEFEQVKQEVVSVFKNRRVFSPIIEDPRNAKSPVALWLTARESKPYTAYLSPSLKLYSKYDKNEIAPYEKIWTEDNEEYAAIYNGNSGDVFLSAAPGFLMGKDAKVAVEPTLELGSHGGDPERLQLHPILYAAGPQIPKGELDESITMLDIAPTLYDLLGIQAPDFVEGHGIF